MNIETQLKDIKEILEKKFEGFTCHIVTSQEEKQEEIKPTHHIHKVSTNVR